MNAKQAKREFADYWRERLQQCPALATDKPAKWEAFAVFIDYLNREGMLSDAVADRITLE